MQITRCNYYWAKIASLNFKAGYKDMSDKDKECFDKRLDDFIYHTKKQNSKKNESRDVFIKRKPAKFDIYNNGEYILQTNDNTIKATMKIFDDNKPLKRRSYLEKADSNVEIVILYSKGGGGGEYMVKEAVKKSEELGYDGRVTVFACKIIPSVGCPIPFYHKLGFKSVDRKIEKEIKEAMKQYNKTGKYNGPEASYMYLSDSKIKKFLG